MGFFKFLFFIFFICRVTLFHLTVSESGYLLFAAGRSRDLVVLLLIVQLSEAVSCRCFFFRVLLLVGFVDFLRVWFSPAFFPRLLLMWLFCFFAWAVVCCAVSGFRVFLLLSHRLGWFGMFVYLMIQCSSCSLFGFFVV